MYSKLFHKDVFMPNGANEVAKSYQLSNSDKYFLSNHFKEHIENQAYEDRSHTYLAPIIEKCLKSLKNTARDCFEIELSKDYYYFGKSGWFVTKYCCRIPYENGQDLVVAIRPQYENGKIVNNMVVTAWLNSSNDHHYTLDKSKYTSEEEWHNITR